MPKTQLADHLDIPRAALVTGAARRVGQAIAEHLALRGTAVAVHCNASRGAAEAVVAAVTSSGGKAVLVQADLCDRRQVEGLVATAAEALGQPLDLLVNNASLFEQDFVDDFQWEGWDRHFAIHVDAPIKLARDFSAALPLDRHGLIVNIIDQRVWKPVPRFFSYGLSKAALWQATPILAQALAPRIRVNAIGPGPTMASSRQSAADFAAQQRSLLLETGPELQEFGTTIDYLWQAKSVTGQMIAIDGGQHLAWQTPDVMGAPE